MPNLHLHFLLWLPGQRLDSRPIGNAHQRLIHRTARLRRRLSLNFVLAVLPALWTSASLVAQTTQKLVVNVAVSVVPSTSSPFPATPTFSPVSGAYVAGQQIVVSDVTPGAVIHYTNDGSVPSAASPVYSAPLVLSANETVTAIAVTGSGKSSSSSSAYSIVSTHLVFTTQPMETVSGGTLNPVPSVSVEDASGNVIPQATNAITLALIGGSSAASLSGAVAGTAVQGQVAFSSLGVVTTGENYQLVATSPGVTSAVSATFSVLPVMTGTSFVVPAANACNSQYDKFYGNEPGVYALWPLCEPVAQNAPAFFDYVNRFDWNITLGSGAGGAAFTFGTTIVGGVPGPVADGETAARVNSQNAFIANQDITMNTRAGTIAVWANTASDAGKQRMLGFQSLSGKSIVSLYATTPTSSSECFGGRWTNAAGTDAFTPSACGYAIGSWHRVVMTWNSGTATLYVDGVSKGSSAYTGVLDNTVYYYALFPQAGDNGLQMSLAKALISNQAWSSAQVAADFAPTFPSIPTGGVLVSSMQLGTIHKDVMGIGDLNSKMNDAPSVAGLKTGIAAAGITSVRLGNGSEGIYSDLSNWNGGTTGVMCGANLSQQALPGQTQPAINGPGALLFPNSGDTTDAYVTQVAQPSGMTLGYTVNYGTNPPACNAGGDPTVNGANLVKYLNVTKGYGFKYFEIGNELYDSNSGGLEADFHVQPYGAHADGGLYSSYEPAFYTQMKAVDPTIKIGIPIGINNDYDWLQYWSLPAMSGATYDAIIYHDYPAQDPVSDGSTLYPERVASSLDRSLGDLKSAQTMLLNSGKPQDAIWITEWNSMTHGGGKWTVQNWGATAPMYVVMRLAEYMNVGVQWATHLGQGVDSFCNPYNFDYQANAYTWWPSCSNSAPIYPAPYPNTTDASEVHVGLQAGSPTPVGRGFQILSKSGFVTEGEHMLKTYVDDANSPWLAAYGATHGSSYALILVNRDRDTTHTVPVKIAGQSSGGSVQQWTYGRAQFDHTYFGDWSVPPSQAVQGSWNGTFQASLPPWSVSVLIFN